MSGGTGAGQDPPAIAQPLAAGTGGARPSLLRPGVPAARGPRGEGGGRGPAGDLPRASERQVRARRGRAAPLCGSGAAGTDRCRPPRPAAPPRPCLRGPPAPPPLPARGGCGCRGPGRPAGLKVTAAPVLPAVCPVSPSFPPPPPPNAAYRPGRGRGGGRFQTGPGGRRRSPAPPGAARGGAGGVAGGPGGWRLPSAVEPPPPGRMAGGRW